MSKITSQMLTLIEILRALSAEMKNISVSGCEDVWLADSAASKHITFHREWFTSFKSFQSDSIQIQIGDDSFVQATGIGSVEVSSLINGKWQLCTLENILYVIPKLKKNLMEAVTNKKIIFDDEKIKIRNF